MAANARLFIMPIDLSKNEIRNVAMQNLASAPGSPSTGQYYWNTTDNTPYIWTGSAWLDLGGDIRNVTNTAPIQVSVVNGVATVSIDDASGSTKGSMSIAHYNLVQNATASPTVSTIMLRDANGRSQAVAGVAANDVIIKSQLDAISTGKDWLKDVLDTQTDATLDPGASPATGDRYIITNSASLHANFGTITGVGDNDVVEYDGADFVVNFDASADPEGATTWDQQANHYKKWDGTNWTEHGGLSGITAGTGLSKSGNTLNVGDVNKGVQANADDLQVDASEITGNGLKQKAGAGNEHLLEIDEASTTEAKARTSSAKVLTPAAIADFTYKVTAQITGDNSTTDFTINHAIGTDNVTVQVFENAAPKALVEVDIQRDDANNVGINFSPAPGTGVKYDVVITG